MSSRGKVVSRFFNKAGNGYVRCIADINHVGVGGTRHAIVSSAASNVGVSSWVPGQSGALPWWSDRTERMNGVVEQGEEQDYIPAVGTTTAEVRSRSANA